MEPPLRAAAIDIGSNGMRFLVVDAMGPDTFEVVHKERAAVRLGHHTFTEGHLDSDVAKAAIKALAKFQDKAEQLGVQRMRAVATSAVRDAEDGKQFVRSVRRKTGLRIEVIDGKEEARLVHRALRDRVPWGDKPWLFTDLGGGSLEIGLATRDGIQWSESRRIGTVRLLEKHAREDDGRMAERIHGEVDGFQLLHSVEGLDIGGLAATGGNINEIARLDGVQPRGPDPSGIALETLTELRRSLEQMTLEERMEAHGFRPDRADVVVPAAMVYERVAFMAHVNHIHVPGWGIREGVILDLMDAHYGHVAHQQAGERALEDDAVAFARAFRFDEGHALHVADLALQIFDSTQRLHGLGHRDRLVLQTAAITHDIGQSISTKGHHKHSQYIIEHAVINGMSEKSMQIASLVARYHRKALPQEHHHLYRLLGDMSRRRVDRLAAILRVADGLDADHLQSVTRIKIDATPIVTISLRGRGSVARQRDCADSKADLFRQAIGPINFEAV